MSLYLTLRNQIVYWENEMESRVSMHECNGKYVHIIFALTMNTITYSLPGNVNKWFHALLNCLLLMFLLGFLLYIFFLLFFKYSFPVILFSITVVSKRQLFSLQFSLSTMSFEQCARYSSNESQHKIKPKAKVMAHLI